MYGPFYTLNNTGHIQKKQNKKTTHNNGGWSDHQQVWILPQYFNT